MVSIYLKIQIALLHSIDFIVRYKQENISQYVIEVLRIDEFSSILNYLTWRLIFLVKGGRRLKKKKKKSTPILPDFRLHCLLGLGLDLLQKI